MEKLQVSFEKFVNANRGERNNHPQCSLIKQYCFPRMGV